MTRKKIRHPKQAKSQRITIPIPYKTPSLIEYPAFSLFYLQNSYCIRKCTQEEKANFAEKLRILSKLTWNQIWSASHQGLGCEKIRSNQITGATIPANISPDVTFLAIRFSGEKPMIGFRTDNIFNIVWFDRDFTLYSHGN